MSVIAMSRTKIDRTSVLHDLRMQDQGRGSRNVDGCWPASGVPAGKPAVLKL